MMTPIMNFPRTIFFPLLFVFSLLFAQQVGAAHALHHVLEDLTRQQADKQALHSDLCEKCADYAKLGSALSVGTYDFTPLLVSDETVQQRVIAFRPIHIFAAAARAPPYSA